MKEIIYLTVFIIVALAYMIASASFAIYFVDEGLMSDAVGKKKYILICLFILFLPMIIFYKVLNSSIELVEDFINYLRDEE